MIRVAWGGLSENDPLRLAVINQLERRGLSFITSTGPANISIISYHVVGGSKLFSEANFVVADFHGEKDYFHSASQSCFVAVSTRNGGEISFVGLEYRWNLMDIDHAVLDACVNFIFSK